MLRSNATTRPVRRRRLRTMVRCIVGVALTVAMMELLLRAAHLGRAPLLPYVVGEGGVPSLPAGVDRTVAFWWGKPTRYVVDDWGARVARPVLAHERRGGGILVVGDSQALGYQIDFPRTFAAKVAEGLTGSVDDARILASPAADPEEERLAVQRYVVGLPKQWLGIVTLNMSNDLDEMFIGGEGVRGAPRSAVQNALMCHSFLYMDCANLWEQYLIGDGSAPGVNPILYAMTADERVVLADQAVRLMEETAALIPAERVIVVIVPNKYQVSVRLFEGFRRYYRSQSEFDRWYAQIPDAADEMNALESYIAARLSADHLPVIRLVGLAKGSKESPGDLFEKTSEHISERGHRLIAEAILGGKV
jgi:hypothetical protein